LEKSSLAAMNVERPTRCEPDEYEWAKTPRRRLFCQRVDGQTEYVHQHRFETFDTRTERRT
jgi:hypothetical protein